MKLVKKIPGGFEMTEKNEQEKSISRRNFLKTAGLTVGGLAVGTGLGSLLKGDKEKNETNPTHEHATENYNKALMYFDQEQLKTIEAATEQIFPKTKVGPGAIDLLVPYYIDHQLAGPWGMNTKEYMSGPFYDKEAAGKFGHQSHLTRQEIFALGIQLLNDEAKTRHQKKFYDLEAKEQVAILQAVEANEVTLNAGATASYFFQLLRGATLEGAYADPMYGGNKDMAGWKMKKFPGHQMTYKNIIEKEEFVAIKPQSLTAQHKH